MKSQVRHHIAISATTVASGVAIFVFTSFVSRNFSPSDAARTLLLLIIINASLSIMNAAVETLSYQRWKHHERASGGLHTFARETTSLLWMSTLPILLSVTVILWFLEDVATIEIFSITTYIIALTRFAGQRILLVVQGNYVSLLVRTCLLICVFVTGIAFLTIQDETRPSTIWLLFALAHVSTATHRNAKSLKNSGTPKARVNLQTVITDLFNKVSFLPSTIYQSLSSVTYVYGSVVVASALSIPDSKRVELSLLLVFSVPPFAIANATLGPFLLRQVELSQVRNFVQMRHEFKSFVAIFALTSALGSLIFLLFGPRILIAAKDDVLVMSRVWIASVALSVGLVSVIGVIRIAFVSLQRPSDLNVLFTLANAIYCAISLAAAWEISAVIAPTAASIFVIAIGMLRYLRYTNHDQRFE